MKSLIIGGTGFVGGYLVRHLVNDYEQEVVVTKMSYSVPVMEGVPKDKIVFQNLNILNFKDIKNLLLRERPDYIYHLAAQSSVKVSWKNPFLTVDVNIKGALNVLEAAKCLDYKPRIILIGSGEEYGHIEAEQLPIDERTYTSPRNVYAVTKLCQNYFGKIYAEAYGLDIIMIRAFNHIGPNQASVFAIPDFCKQIAEIEAGKQKPIIRVGNLKTSRDFTDVRDVVRAYALLSFKGTPGETYNVGSGKAMPVADILQMILEESSVDVQIYVDEEKLRPVDAPIILADITKLKNATGWSPEIEIKETIKETLDYWRKRV